MRKANHKKAIQNVKPKTFRREATTLTVDIFHEKCHSHAEQKMVQHTLIKSVDPSNCCEKFTVKNYL